MLVDAKPKFPRRRAWWRAWTTNGGQRKETSRERASAGINSTFE